MLQRLIAAATAIAGTMPVTTQACRPHQREASIVAQFEQAPQSSPMFRQFEEKVTQLEAGVIQLEAEMIDLAHCLLGRV